MVFPPEDWTVTSPDDWLMTVYSWPATTEVVGSFTVCVVDPVKIWTRVDATVNVVVEPAVACDVLLGAAVPTLAVTIHSDPSDQNSLAAPDGTTTLVTLDDESRYMPSDPCRDTVTVEEPAFLMMILRPALSEASGNCGVCGELPV